jgi:hypothetical protein
VFVDYDNRDNMLRDVTFNLKVCFCCHAEGWAPPTVRVRGAARRHTAFAPHNMCLLHALPQDFRAMLQLCEAMRANVTLRFDRAGDPLLVGPHLQGDAPVSLPRLAFHVLPACVRFTAQLAAAHEHT